MVKPSFSLRRLGVGLADALVVLAGIAAWHYIPSLRMAAALVGIRAAFRNVKHISTAELSDWRADPSRVPPLVLDCWRRFHERTGSAKLCRMQIRHPTSRWRFLGGLLCSLGAGLASDEVRAESSGLTESAPRPVWIDTDPAVGEKDRDVDDGLALVQAFHSPELAIRGVSVVFGNAPLAAAIPVARSLAEKFGPKGLAVYEGAAGAQERGAPTPASDALATALGREPLSILLLGPATNLATVLLTRPELASRIQVVVAVAGRRPGQRFTTGTANPRGHRDFNFEQDPGAFAILLSRRVPLVLTPFEISSQVWLTEADLTKLAVGGAAGRYLAAPAHRWLKLWQQVFHVDGFNPFDTLAVGFLTHPGWFACTMLNAGIERRPDDATEARMQGSGVPDKPYLLVRAPVSPQTATVRYCSSVHRDFKPELLRRLTSRASLR